MIPREEMKDPLIEALNERAEQLVEENAVLREQVQAYRAEIETLQHHLAKEYRASKEWIKSKGWMGQ